MSTLDLCLQLRAAKTDEEAAECLRRCVETHVRWDDLADFHASLLEILPLPRELYLLLYLDTGVSGDGFPEVFSHLPALRDDMPVLLSLIGLPDLAAIVREAFAYLGSFKDGKVEDIAFYDMDLVTNDLHGRYFGARKGLVAAIGRHARKHVTGLLVND